MADKPRWSRVVLKLSGEALASAASDETIDGVVVVGREHAEASRGLQEPERRGGGDGRVRREKADDEAREQQHASAGAGSAGGADKDDHLGRCLCPDAVKRADAKGACDAVGGERVFGQLGGMPMPVTVGRTT